MLLLKRYQSLQQISNKCTAIRECLVNILKIIDIFHKFYTQELMTASSILNRGTTSFECLKDG